MTSMVEYCAHSSAVNKLCPDVRITVGFNAGCYNKDAEGCKVESGQSPCPVEPSSSHVTVKPSSMWVHV